MSSAQPSSEHQERKKDSASLTADQQVDESSQEDVPQDALGTARRLWRAARGQHWRLVVAAICAVLYVVGSIAAATYSATVVDVVWTNIQRTVDAGGTYVVGMDNGGTQMLVYLGIWTVAWAFYAVQALVMASFAERLNLQLRQMLSRKLQLLPLSFLDAHQPGDLISRATNDLDQVSQVMQRGLLQLIIAACSLVGNVAMMFVYGWVLALVFVAFAALALLLTKVLSARTLRAAAQRQEVMGALTGTVEEEYTGRVVVKAYGLERRSLQEVSDQADELARASAHADFLTNAVSPAVRLLGRLGQVVIALLAGGMLLAGRMSVGGFQAFFQYVMGASEPLTELSLTVNMLQSALAAAERVFALLDQEQVPPDPEQPARLPLPVRGRVAFEHVRFGYAPDSELMHDVNLTVEPGQKVAIVGATGAGKTTLVNLLMRFYEVWDGRITLDGVDTRRLPVSQLRAQFGMVLQDAWLFQGTIAENIAFGRPGATREQVEQAVRSAHVDYFVRTLPQGYDTVLDEDADGISQGQRQLLTIARAMLRDPAILILDEATSSVDTRTEQAITRAMETLMAGRTSFVIAHRLSTIVDADLILVMDHGTIVEKGTHAQLMRLDGAYAQLYRSQFA